MKFLWLFLLMPFLNVFPSIGTFLKTKILDDFIYGDPTFLSSDCIEYNQLNDYLSFKYSDISPYLVSEYRLYGLTSSGVAPFYNQYGESVFHKYISSGVYSSEGNCGLVSTANALAYYKTYGGKNALPLTTSTVNIVPQSNASLFMYAIDHGYSPKSSNVLIHTIYAKEREYAIALGYKIGGLNNSETESLFESTCSFYGYSNSNYDGLSSCDKDVLFYELNNNRPVQIRTNNDAAYGGHGMMATGYKYYSVILYNELLDTYYQSYLVFVSVWDGSESERWYDIPSCTGLPSIYNRADSVSLAKMIVA